MKETDGKHLSTIEAITASIETDTHVYRWFLLLALHPSMRQRISEDEKSDRSYRTLKIVMTVQGLTGAALVATLITAWTLRVPGLLVISTILFWTVFHLHKMKKEAVTTMAHHLLTSDPEWPLLKQQTLYMISERYSRMCNIPSMVDVVCFSNRTLRWAVVAGFVLAVIVLPFKGHQNVFSFLAVYLTVYTIVNLQAINKRIK